MERNKEGLKASKTHQDILNDPVLNKLAEDYENLLSPEEKRIFDLSLDKSIRTRARKKSSSKREVNFTIALNANNPKHFDFQIYLEQITKDLEKEGLWLEESKEGLESDLFPIDDLKDDDLDSGFNPKKLTSILSLKSIKKRERDNTKKDFQEEGIEWQDDSSLSLSDLPQFTTPTSHHLLRRSSWSIEEKIARLMIEGTFFDKNILHEELFPCAYFFSKGIFDKYTFIRVKYEAFAKTPLQKRFRTYPFRRYKKDQKLLKKLIHEVLKNYYLKHILIKKSVSLYAEKKKLSQYKKDQILKSIWPRFLKVLKTLTDKQAEALHAVYTEEPRLTFTEAAQELKISRDSLQDRVKGAIKKIKSVLPELEAIKSMTELKIDTKKRRYLYDGLFCKESARKIALLYRICPYTNIRTELSVRKEAPLLNDLAPSRFIIRAWAIYHTPIPDFLDTEFYCGLIPEGALRRRGK